MSFLLNTERADTNVLTQIGSMLSAFGKWGTATVSDASRKAEWTFQDIDGKRWRASAHLSKADGNVRKHVLSLELRAQPPHPETNGTRAQVVNKS